MVIDEQRAEFASGGRALIVGSVGPDGAPHASRGWGLRIDGDHTVVMIDADDVVAYDHLGPGRPLAVTATDIPTLESVQFKGISAGVGPVTDADLAAVRSYIDAFVEVISTTDHIEAALVARVVPGSFVACRFTATELYDQTPGPGAGQPLDAAGAGSRA